MPVGPLKSRRLPEGTRRQIEIATATAWEALVEVHTSHALRFVALLSARAAFDEALDRYLSEIDVRDPMSSAVRTRVLVALEDATRQEADRPSISGYDEAEAEPGDDGLRRFRPDILMKGIAKRARDSEEVDQWVALAIARAEEGVIKAHVDNAVLFAALLHEHQPLIEAVEDYIEAMRVSGGRAQAVFQRTMARLADLHLPAPEEPDGNGTETGEPDR